MTCNNARTARKSRIIYSAMIAAYALLVSAASDAQTDQKIILRCLFSPASTVEVVLDLAAKTISKTLTASNNGGSSEPIVTQGRVTQVTDQLIRSEFRLPKVNADYVLNRKTLSLTVTEYAEYPVTVPCQLK